jgi:hypothetical protein
MFVHAEDAALGVIVSRHTAEGTLREAIAAATRVVKAFDVVPCAHLPKLHLIEIDPGAPLPAMADRAALAELARATKSPRWMACVLPARQARLVADIVLLLAPARADRRLQVFETRGAAMAWLLTTRPEVQARMLSLASEVDRLAQEHRSAAGEAQELRAP